MSKASIVGLSQNETDRLINLASHHGYQVPYAMRLLEPQVPVIPSTEELKIILLANNRLLEQNNQLLVLTYQELKGSRLKKEMSDVWGQAHLVHQALSQNPGDEELESKRKWLFSELTRLENQEEKLEDCNGII
jgi:hypothetical protein